MALVPSSAQPHNGILVQRTVEYRISGGLDGNTPAEGTPVLDEENIFVVAVDGDAGLFDPSRFSDGSASFGDRYVEWIEVILDGAVAPPGAVISVVDANALVPSVANIIELRRIADADFVGQSHFYSPLPFFVAQCTAISIRGVPPGAGIIRVLFGVRQPTTAFEQAILAAAWCRCQPSFAFGDGGGTPPPPDAVVSLDFPSFSALTLSIVPTNFGHYFTFSGSFDPGGPTDSSDAIIAVVAEEDLLAIPGAVKLSIRPGVITSLVFRTETSIVATFFVELAVGAGAFVRTNVTAAVALAGNINHNVPIALVPYAADTRIRFGFTSPINAAAINVQATLEIATPIP